MNRTRESALAEHMGEPAPLRARRMGIHTQHEAVVFMRADCHVCRSEGLTASSRVLLRSGGRECLATLYQVSSDILDHDEAGLSESAWERLRVADGAACRRSAGWAS